MPRGIGSKSPPTTPAEMDLALDRLDAGAPRLAALPASERALLLHGLLRRFHELSPRFVELDARAKGLELASPRAGEPALEGPAIILRYLGELGATLSGARRVTAERVREVGGRSVVDALPLDAYDSLLFRGYRAEVWLDRVTTAEGAATLPSDLPSTHSGEIALVLGAGNVASIGVLDAVEQCFVRGRAVMFKLSPVNDYHGPLLELAFAPLVERGFMAFAYGGVDVGAYLAAHPAIDAIHITGSYETHEAIVWGADATERAARKARNEPFCTKPVTSELGNVSPAVVVPGAWTERELEHAAQSIAGSFAFNAGFNCNATKLIVTPAGSELRSVLLARIAEILRGLPLRTAYYPGAVEKYARFTHDGGRLQELGPPNDVERGMTRWGLVTDLVVAERPACFEHEPFCAVLSEVPIASDDPVEFLAAVAPFLNEKVWGTLNAMLLVPEAVERDPVLGPRVDAAIEALNYGSVCVNVWPAVAYGLGTLPWGGHPSATLANVQSGLGFGHNSLLLRGAEKSVLRAPLVQFPKPFWYPGHRSLNTLASRWVDLQAAPSPWRLARVATAALGG